MTESLQEWIVDLTRGHKKSYPIDREYLENRGEKYLTTMKQFFQYIEETKHGTYIHNGTTPWDYKIPYGDMEILLFLLYSMFPSRSQMYHPGIIHKQTQFMLGGKNVSFSSAHLESAPEGSRSHYWMLFIE